MNSALSTCPYRTDWRPLCIAAILGNNKNVLPKRVLEAEAALIARGREIFYDPTTLEEKDALEDAQYALRAFRIAWLHTQAA